MPLFEFTSNAIVELERVDFVGLGLLERSDLQRLIRDRISVISQETLIISEEFSSWDRSNRRIDLLGVDRQGRLVVVELKRTTDDVLADLQALRYAAMVSKMTFEEAVNVYRSYLTRRNQEEVDARASLLEFLERVEPGDGPFAQDTRIVLAAADFSPEITSTVLWLNESGLDITCIRIQPYRLRDAVLVDVEQIIPLPEAADYQVQIRQRDRENRAAVAAAGTRYNLTTGGEIHRRLNVREVILFAVRYLIRQMSITPEDIRSTVGRQVFESVEGQVDGPTFRAELIQRRPNDGRIAQRFFSQDDQLFSIGGRTYALTNQWGRPSMEPAMQALIARYGTLGLSYAVATEPNTAMNADAADQAPLT